MNVLFIENQLCIRGTSVAVHDYAKFNESYLNNISYIAAPAHKDLTTLTKFQKSFPNRVFLYSTEEELVNYVYNNSIDIVYHITSGQNCENCIPDVKNVYHAVFNVQNTNITAYVSSWLSKQNGNAPFVPHIVELPEVEEDYREFLGIPKDATVVCRHGGYDTFNIHYAQRVVYNIALANPSLYFLFLNTEPFCPVLPNIIHLAPTTDKSSIASFLATGNIYLHARDRGESFGIAICEALAANLPVITCINGEDRHHIQLMGDKGFYYSSDKELEAILSNFKRPDYDYRGLVECFKPKTVMQQFEHIFLK